MSTFNLKLQEKYVAVLLAEATAGHMTIEEYLQTIIEERLEARKALVEKAMEYALAKNHELHKRLA